MADAPVRLKIAIRTLAQLTCRRGDIHFRYDDSTDAQEGIDVQKRLQRDRPATYEREAPVKCIWREGDVELELTGRADGCDHSIGLVEEFKATRADHVRLFEHAGCVHLGQLRLYAAVLARDDAQHTQWNLRLLYCDPDTDTSTPFEERMTRDALGDFLNHCCRRLATWLLELRAHRAARDAHLAQLKFPFAEFRPAQRALSADVYRTVRDGGALLFEAPTGSGKTLSVLFPSLIAMGQGNTDRVVFLSSRTTGQATAEGSIDLLDTGDVVRRVTVTAKAKMCLMPEPVCDPAICPYARGYYDRSEAAVGELLAVGRMTRSAIERVARAHTVCPFELSLDAAVWADVVICDYNYVFDPVVRLKRLAGIADDRIALLIDEAHQLGDRVRDSLSATLDRGHIARARDNLSGTSAKRAVALDRRLTTLRRDVVRARDLDRSAFECRIDRPDSLFRSAEALLETLTDGDDDRSRDPAVTELLFALLRLLRVAGWYDAGRFAVFLRGRGSDIELDLRCLDPSATIADTLQEYRAHIRFSATLSPFELTGRAHGQPDVRALRLPSPFPPERLGVFVVPDISTLYRNRPQSLPRLVDAIRCVADSHAGNYLVALPSFEYLDLVADAYTSRHPDQLVLRQARGMSDESRAAFIEVFLGAGAQVIAFAVLGGVFTESIDLPNDALHGIIVVGIGLPPPSLERNEMAQVFGTFGRMLAYEQPAMTRVVQAAGRLIRRATDRGVVCLIDDRFLSKDFRQYLPRHWQPVRTPARELSAALRAFWDAATV